MQRFDLDMHASTEAGEVPIIVPIGNHIATYTSSAIVIRDLIAYPVMIDKLILGCFDPPANMTLPRIL